MAKLTAGDRLVQAQLKAHLSFDALYSGVQSELVDAILAEGVFDDDDRMVNNPLAMDRIMKQMTIALRNLDPQVAVIIVDSIRDAEEAAMRAAEEEVPEQPIDLGLIDVAIRADRARQLEQLRQRITREANKRSTSEDVTDTVKAYYDPYFATIFGIRTVHGSDRLHARRTHFKRMRQEGANHWPAAEGMGSQGPRRMMAALTTTFHANTMVAACLKANRGLKWRMSYQHKDHDECDGNAKRDVGYGPGVYLPGAEPRVPAHYGCRCYYEPVNLPGVTPVTAGQGANQRTYGLRPLAPLPTPGSPLGPIRRG